MRTRLLGTLWVGIGITLLSYPSNLHASLVFNVVDNDARVLSSPGILEDIDESFSEYGPASLSASFQSSGSGSNPPYSVSANLNYSSSVSGGVTTFRWIHSEEQSGGKLGIIGQVHTIFNFTNDTPLFYTFTSNWDGLTSGGFPEYQAELSGATGFFDKTPKNHSGILSIGSVRLDFSANVNSGALGPDAPATSASGEYILTLSNVSAVPEPSSIALLSVGAFGLAFGAYPKRRQSKLAA